MPFAPVPIIYLQFDGVLWILLGKVPASPGADTNADFTIDAADLLEAES